MSITSIQLGELIGHGSYGSVYKCVDNYQNILAVKCININDDGIMYLMELSLMASLNHPNLNKTIQIYVSDNKIYLIQELAICDLYRWRKSSIPSTEQLHSWSYQLIRAVEYLHDHHLIHGDIKATNILLYPNDYIKLTDFTLTTHQDWPKNNTICTCTHRPLEVWLRRGWDEKVDIWALGCSLFEISYGNSLFPQQNSDDSYINAILDWATKGPIFDIITKSLCSYKDVLYKSFVLPESFDLNLPLNQLIIHMLSPDINMRPSIKQCLSIESIKSNPNNPNFPIEDNFILKKNKILASIRGYVEKWGIRRDMEQIVKMSFNLYKRLRGIRNLAYHYKIIGVIWISYKLIFRQILDPSVINITIGQINNIERLICYHLGYRIYDVNVDIDVNI